MIADFFFDFATNALNWIASVLPKDVFGFQATLEENLNSIASTTKATLAYASLFVNVKVLLLLIIIALTLPAIFFSIKLFILLIRIVRG